MIIMIILFMKIFIRHVVNICTRHWLQFAIRSVSLFKYFKLNSLFCSDCYSLHFCSMWQCMVSTMVCDFSTGAMSVDFTHYTQLYQTTIVPTGNRFYAKPCFGCCFQLQSHVARPYFHTGALSRKVPRPHAGLHRH